VKIGGGTGGAAAPLLAMSTPGGGPVSMSSPSEASDRPSICHVWRRCGGVSAAIPLSQPSNSALSMLASPRHRRLQWPIPLNNAMLAIVNAGNAV
jgi:hypothetical protein